MTYDKFKNWLHTSKYKQVIRTNANQDQMMLDAWNACLEMQSQAQKEPEELTDDLLIQMATKADLWTVRNDVGMAFGGTAQLRDFANIVLNTKRGDK